MHLVHWVHLPVPIIIIPVSSASADTNSSIYYRLMMNPFIQKALSAIRRFPPKEVIFKSSVPDAERAKWHIAHDPKTGSIMTNDRLRVLIDADGPNGKLLAHLRDVFAIGDCAVIKDTKYPATAQVASQKAVWLAKRLNKQDLHTTRFTFRNLGIMAYVGNWKAIFEGGKGVGNVSGRTAWILWRVSEINRCVLSFARLEIWRS